MTLDPSPGHTEVLSLLEPLDVALGPALADLHARLALDAQLTHTLDIAYRTVDSPVGKLLLAATDRGIIRVAFELENHDSVLQLLADTVSPRILEAPTRLDDAARELEEYFAGTRRDFDLILDFRLSRGFRLNVLRHLPRIPYGNTASYAQVAKAAGSPNAVRAVGTACATNPLPVIVPCHRVVKSDGSFGGYLGGPEAKRALLTLEAAA
ncbi:methylated-DNA-[protein]-cysteine S-methyltransferase [Paenarthrobacter nicotinovorans]|uniref:Methylated-DNA--protein-cysteine methyltransferase n=1 Tax=Paenarthrobacter nicotinovorans TaxID=29320 RepID=A0ABT9TM71_PAENI|nr:methylated-DNA--[protein]-cysteine S-methyltransferase [Paenarthrobacter nicotinovorans]MDQ0102759.1 methylated-DNA-[protein]-cysteine S-methyltransferase [Paenarthrobacter nicotinovorans]